MLHSNPYIEEILLKKIPKFHDKFKTNILYVCQPFNEDNLLDIDAINYLNDDKMIKKQIFRTSHLRTDGVFATADIIANIFS